MRCWLTRAQPSVVFDRTITLSCAQKQQWLLVPAQGRNLLSAAKAKAPAKSSKKSKKPQKSKSKAKSKTKAKSAKSKKSSSKNSKRSGSSGRKCSQSAYVRPHRSSATAESAAAPQAPSRLRQAPQACRDRHGQPARAREARRLVVRPSSLLIHSLTIPAARSTLSPSIISRTCSRERWVRDPATRCASERLPVNDRGNAAGGSSQLGTILDELDWANRDQMWTLRKA